MSVRNEKIKLCGPADIVEGQACGFDVPGLGCKVIVVRKNDEVFGYLDSCPHYEGGTPMAWKKDAYLDGEGEFIACHSHGALFEIETGECVLGPCLGQCLTTVPLRIDESGSITTDLEGLVEEMA